jgi:hypothetical protein
MTKAIQLVLTATVVTLAACGSSGPSQSKADFVRQADAVCKTDNAQLAALISHVGSHPTLSEVRGIYTSTVIPLFRKELRSLQALKPPAADRATVEKLLGDLSSGVDQLEAGVRDAKTLAGLESIATPGLKRAGDDARAYGMKVCGT